MTPHFIGTLELAPLADGRHWRLAHPFGFWCEATGQIHVPKGFETDLASVPQIFWNLFPPFGKYDDAAVVHDYLYRTHMTCRYVADRCLLLGMVIRGVPGWQRAIIYGAVRIFGRFAYNNHRRRVAYIRHSGRNSFGRHQG